MLKALLIVTALSGAEYTAQFPSMQECLEAKKVMQQQDEYIKTLCVPIEDEHTNSTKQRNKCTNAVKHTNMQTCKMKRIRAYSDTAIRKCKQNKQSKKYGRMET